MKKNLLFICDYAATYTGNFIASLAQLTAKLQQEGTEVFFLFPEGARGQRWLSALPVDASHFYFASFSPRSLGRACRRLKKSLGGKQTLVHTHFVGDFQLLAVRLAFSNVICHYHMTVPVCFNLMKKIKRLVRCLIYYQVVLVGVSEAVTADLKKYFWNPPCDCVRNAIDFEMLEKCAAGTALPEVFQGPEPFRILIHGTDFYRKGVDLAAQAVQQLNQAEPGAFGLYVTSHDPDQAKGLVEALTPGNGNVTVVRPVENIKKVYDSMDLFISPSREEAFGYAVVEAAASGCQVAASDIPGQNTMKLLPHILWFPQEDAQALAQTILQAREQQRSGAGAIRKPEQQAAARALFGIHRWVGENLAVYEKYFG